MSAFRTDKPKKKDCPFVCYFRPAYGDSAVFDIYTHMEGIKMLSWCDDYIAKSNSVEKWIQLSDVERLIDNARSWID